MLTSKQRYNRRIDESYLLKLVVRPLRFELQGGRCCYCESPMWEIIAGESRPKSAVPFKRLYGLKYPEASRLMCTSEHLTGRKDDGSNHVENIAAACSWCNSKRFNVDENITPLEYKAYVMKHMRWGSWFDFDVHSVFEYTYTPTRLDKFIGKVIRYKRAKQAKIKAFRLKYRLVFPQQMTLNQCIHSTIRLYLHL